MRWGPILSIALVALAHEPAIAARYKVEIAPTEGQITRIDSGNRLVGDRSDLTGATVMVSGEAQNSSRIVTSVGLLNNGPAPIDFGPENVRVCIADTPCQPILTHEDMVKQVRRQAKRAAIGEAIADGANGFSAGMSGGYSGYGTVTGGGRTYNYNYSGVDQGARQAAIQESTRRAARNQDAIQAGAAARIASLSGALQTTTVDPGKYHTGLVFFDLPKGWKDQKAPAPIIFEISVGGETHRIKGTIRKE